MSNRVCRDDSLSRCWNLVASKMISPVSLVTRMLLSGAALPHRRRLPRRHTGEQGLPSYQGHAQVDISNNLDRRP
jgi:hypothetical protein